MSGETRGKRRHQEHEEHEEHVNHEAWVIPYADVLTLLMALFLVLWALGDPDPDATEIAAESFRRELGGRGGISDFDIGFGTGGGPLANGGVSVLEGAGPAPMSGERDENSVGSAASDDPLPSDDILDGLPPESIEPEDPRFDPMDNTLDGGGLLNPIVDEKPPLLDEDEGDGDGLGEGDGDGLDEGDGRGDGGAQVDPLDEIEQAVRDEAVGSGLATAVGFRREVRGLVVSIVADQVLFNDGAAAVQADGAVVLSVIVDALADKSNPIIIEGHTDSRPISTAQYPSNWELSTARATSVLRFLTEDLGMDAARLSAAGYADTRPIAEGDDPESLAKNRRVEIVVIG